MLNVSLKNYFSDRYLKELREQISEYIPKNSRVIDIGCRTGAFLFELSPRIEYGLGIDKDSRMIKFAQKKLERIGYRNLEFELQDANTLSSKRKYDIAILSFVIHSLKRESRLDILKRASLAANELIIVDYVSIGGFKDFLVYMDELLSWHYINFRDYQKQSMENLVEEAGLIFEENIKTKYSEIRIWTCSSWNPSIKPLFHKLEHNCYVD